MPVYERETIYAVKNEEDDVAASQHKGATRGQWWRISLVRTTRMTSPRPTYHDCCSIQMPCDAGGGEFRREHQSVTP